MSIDLAECRLSPTTSLELVHPVTKEPTGAFIHGHAFGSAGWEAAVQEITGPPKKTNIIIEKRRQVIEVDPGKPHQRRTLIASVVTGIEGVSIKGKPFKFSRQAVLDLFADPQYGWLVKQWDEHLEEAEDFIAAPRTAPPSTSDASAG